MFNQIKYKMKQTIEIEVPDGKKAIWKNGKIEFVDINVMELLENSKYPEETFMEIIAKTVKNGDNDLFDLYNEYMNSPVNTHIALVAKLKLFLAYLNKGHKFDLISENIYYPYIKFYRKDKLPKSEPIISYFEYEGDVYALVWGGTLCGPHTGLANFDSYHNIGVSSSYCGFLACKDKETAKFVATTFGKLLFDVNFGSLIDYKWLS